MSKPVAHLYWTEYKNIERDETREAFDRMIAIAEENHLPYTQDMSRFLLLCNPFPNPFTKRMNIDFYGSCIQHTLIFTKEQVSELEKSMQ